MLEEYCQFSPGELRLKLDFFPSLPVIAFLSRWVGLLYSKLFSFSVLFGVVLNCTLVSDHREQTGFKKTNNVNQNKNKLHKKTPTPKNLSLEALSCHSSGLCKQCGLIFGCVFSPLCYHSPLDDLLFSCMMCVSIIFPHTGMKMALCGFGMHLGSAYISFIS